MADPTSADERRRSLKPLRRVFPYITRYRGLVIGACISLVLAAVTTLALPLAVRRMIDNGFSNSDSAFIASYFGMLMIMSCTISSGASKPNTARLPIFSLMILCPSSSICLAFSRTGPRMS